MLRVTIAIITLIIIVVLIMVTIFLAKAASLDERRERDYQEYLKRRHDLK